MAVEYKNVTPESDRYERSLALQLQQSLLQISQYAQIDGHNNVSIDVLARRALDMVDCYLAGSIQPNQLALEIETISLGSVAQDALHHLTPTARQYGCQLQLKTSGAKQLVSTDKKLSKAVFVALGHSFIEQAATAGNKGEVVFALRGNSHAQTAGVFVQNAQVSARSLRQLRKLSGNAQKQCSAMAGTSTGIVLADRLLARMEKQLFTTRFQRASGMAVSFAKTEQLQLV